MALVCWYFMIITVLIQNLNSETRYCNGGSCSCAYEGMCSLNCHGKDICKGSGVTLGCRPGYPCIVHCDSKGEENACEDALVDGSSASDVYVFCTDTQSCLNMRVNCGSGMCRVICTGSGFNGNSCNGVNLNCAPHSWCSIECQKPIDVPEGNTCPNVRINTDPTTREFACLRPGLRNTECDVIDRSLMPFKMITAAPSSSTLNPTSTPTKTPTFPTLFPTGTPTKTPTNRPSINPTRFPSNTPTVSPTSPTKYPTISPTLPTKFPTASPTPKPSNNPSMSPTNNPSNSPTPKPSTNPTKTPTKSPTQSPTPRPTPDPASEPTPRPSRYPTTPPSRAPTPAPTQIPSRYPTRPPTISPTKYPTHPPTKSPTSPTNTPSRAPTLAIPTPKPTGTPTIPPTTAPTNAPTKTPSAAPSQPPTIAPTGTPTKTPSNAPTTPPTMAPTQVPTMPTREPTIFYYVVDFVKPPTMADNIDDVIVDDNDFSTPEVIGIVMDNWLYAAIAGGITLCCFVLICTRCCKRCRRCGRKGNKNIAAAAGPMGGRKHMQHVKSQSRLKRNGKGDSLSIDAQSSNEHFIPPPPLEPPPEDLVREHHKRGKSAKFRPKISIELIKADNSSLNEGIQAAMPLNETRGFLAFESKNGPKPAYVNHLENEDYNDQIDLINMMVEENKHKRNQSKNFRKKSFQKQQRQRQIRKKTSTVNSVSAAVDFDIPEMEIEPSQMEFSEMESHPSAY